LITIRGGSTKDTVSRYIWEELLDDIFLTLDQLQTTPTDKHPMT